MDISYIPDTILLKIFLFLPYKYRFISGRVSKTFHRVSLLATSKTSRLSLGRSIFKKLTSENLARILEQCQKNLKSITFGPSDPSDFIETFSHFSFPKLTTLSIGWTALERNVFQDLFRNNPNLETFQWQVLDYEAALWPSMVCFPNDIVASKLTNLHIDFCDDILLLSLIGKCPNLVSLNLCCYATPRTSIIIDEILGQTPKLRSVYVHAFSGYKLARFVPHEMKNLWNPRSLTTIKINLPIVFNDDTLVQVIKMFPDLTCLWAPFAAVTDAGLRLLTAMERLSDVWLETVGDVNEGVRTLSALRRLESLRLPQAALSSTTFVFLISSNPNLRYLKIHYINDVDMLEEACGVIDSISAEHTVKARVVIQSRREFQIWKSPDVEAALEELKEKHGHDISISVKK